MEAAQCEAIEVDASGPRGRGDQFEEDRLTAVQAVTNRLAHIADRTLQQARTADAAPDPRHQGRRRPADGRRERG